MIVYHGSCIEVSAPDTVHSRKAVDFGQGFYVTPIYDQAKKWSEKVKRLPYTECDLLKRLKKGDPIWL